ncbi:hypothetical protein ACIBI4_18805 [Streptomyces sp. NPDC050418]|uniref:hypothetical protein n=1 Tax=Streptomyces sp. NPDC050418 TaxID=3365612 RepID=UPI00378B3ACE
MNAKTHPTWVPATGIQLHLAGVQFDAVRVDGDAGLALAATLSKLTGGDPGPIVAEANGRRAVYFFVPPGSTSHRAWPPDITRLTAGPGRISYVPVPSLTGRTWPLSWLSRPTPDGHLVHVLLLRNALGVHGPALTSGT